LGFLSLIYDAQFPSGAPQVEAGIKEKSWDFGGAGVVPNILGYVKRGAE
jgi:hypothetical protein